VGFDAVMRDEAVAFLKAHQPLPPDEDLPQRLIEQFDEARRYFEAHPDPEAASLLLGSLGNGTGFGVYQLVPDALHAQDRETVVQALIEALKAGPPSVRTWSMEFALEYPDPHLDRHAIAMLESPLRDDRYWAAAYLIERGSKVPASLIDVARRGETDDELVEILDELQAKS
jgi:hypothetical protein